MKSLYIGVLLLFSASFLHAGSGSTTKPLAGSYPIVLSHGILGFDDTVGLFGGAIKYWGGMDTHLRAVENAPRRAGGCDDDGAEHSETLAHLSRTIPVSLGVATSRRCESFDAARCSSRTIPVSLGVATIRIEPCTSAWAQVENDPRFAGGCDSTSHDACGSAGITAASRANPLKRFWRTDISGDFFGSAARGT